MEISLNAYGKINLGLDVVRRREDGYHEVKMVMQTVDLYDRLVFRDIDEDQIIIESDSDELPDVENNIIYKSYMLLKKAYGISRGLHVNVEKHIPVAAGMAGGSADAAATLVAVNRIFELGLSEQQLMEYGVRIGADVPYCIMQGTALAEGIGEVLSPLPSMPECWILIAKPNIGVSTKWVYENLHVDTLDRNQHPDIDILVDALKEGDACLAAGGRGGGSAFSGEILSSWIYMEDYGQYMIWAKAEIEPGMSGGGLFDGEGNLVGILSGGSEDGELAAVPVSIIWSEWEADGNG